MTRTLLAVLPALLLATPALAAGPDLTAAATVSPSSVTAGTAARFTARMCNAGDRRANGAYLSTMLPSVSYAVAAQPRGGSCRAVRYGTGVYLYCMVTLNPGQCGDLVLNVTPAAAGSYELNCYADMNNLIRESNETNNTAITTLTAS